MKRISLFAIGVAACLVAPNAVAAGSVDKVTGDFTEALCFDCMPGDALSTSHRLISAHEASGDHAQKGFLLYWRDNAVWFEVDFSDTTNTCINVYENGHARIGGLVSDGNGPQVGRYFGFYIVDEGEPAWFVDHGMRYRVSLDPYSEEARLALLDWCETGDVADLDGQQLSPTVVIEGNVQVHNSPSDGD
jgi:hypothetical protein